MIGDEELFEELQRLVSPPFREPPAGSVTALHAAVTRQFGPKARRQRWKQKMAVGAAVFGLIAGAPAAAFAISGTLPDPLRTAMHAIGLPVDSVPVADTKSAEADLEHALQNREATEIQKAARHLQSCLEDLDGADRARLGSHADSLLAQAVPNPNNPRNSPELSEGRPSGDNPGEDGGPISGDTNSGLTNGSSGSTGSSADGSSQTAGGSGGSGDSDQTTTLPPTTIAGGGSTSSDGGQSNTTSTTAPVQGQSQDGATTTTTVQSGSNSDHGASSSTDGAGTATTTTTTDPSH